MQIREQETHTGWCDVVSCCNATRVRSHPYTNYIIIAHSFRLLGYVQNGTQSISISLAARISCCRKSAKRILK